MKAPSWLSRLFMEEDKFEVTPNLITDDHWQTISGRRHDRSWSEIQELYTDSLTAWRKNPMAWRIISTMVNYVVGSGISLTSPIADMDDFINRFWQHRKNRMDLRLAPMCEELVRSGDLFVLLVQERCRWYVALSGSSPKTKSKRLRQLPTIGRPSWSIGKHPSQASMIPALA